jgi:hypothetical protein
MRHGLGFSGLGLGAAAVVRAFIYVPSVVP